MYIEYYLYYLYYTFLGYPFVIRVAIIGSILFIILFLVIITVFFTKRSSFNRKRKYQKKIDGLYAEQLEAIITADNVFTKEEIDKMLSGKMKHFSKLQKRILTNRLIRFRHKAFQVNKVNYHRVVEFFDLQNFWEKRLKYGDIKDQMTALRKFDDLDVEIPGAVISPLTYNRNPYIRRKARTYYMYFNKNSPYKFLDEDFDQTFNKWDEIELHRMFCRKQKEGLPVFSQWIKKSQKVSFICFLIDEIAFFNQQESASFLVELAKSEDIDIRKHAIRALGNMNYQNAEDILIKEYSFQPLSVQEEIILAIKKMCTGQSLTFLKRAYESSNNNEMRIIILNAIFNYGEVGETLFQTMRRSTSGFTRLTFDHVSSPLI